MTALRHLDGPAQSGGERQAPAAAAITDLLPAGTAGHAATRIDWSALRSAGRACCCSAGPAVVVLMPPSAGRPHRTELLMCMHHVRTSRRALQDAGAAVLDFDGMAVRTDAAGYLLADSCAGPGGTTPREPPAPAANQAGY